MSSLVHASAELKVIFHRYGGSVVWFRRAREETKRNTEARLPPVPAFSILAE